MTNNEQINKLVDDFIATGETVENIRDIWYQIKHEAQLIPNNNKAWDKAVTEQIGDHLYDLYLGGDVEVYSKLDIMTKDLDGAKYGERTPIVIFSEKVTRATINASEALNCARYSSRGQIPKFEATKVAEYLAEHAIDNKCFLVGMTDYDPAGQSIFRALMMKVMSCLEVLAPEVELSIGLVKFGDDYSEVVELYPSYELSKDYLPNLKWIRKGETRGVEMNVVHDKRELLEDVILAKVDPAIVESLSLSRARLNKVIDLEEANETLKSLREQIEKIEIAIREEVENMESTFTPEWSDTLTSSAVTNMTEIK